MSINSSNKTMKAGFWGQAAQLERVNVCGKIQWAKKRSQTKWINAL